MKIRNISVLLALSSLPSTLFAVDFNWNATTGDWSNAANWTPAGPPTGGAGNFAIINNGGTAEITSNTNSMQDAIIANGANTSGTVNHSAGILTNTGWMFVARDPGAPGTPAVGAYNMSGTSVLNAGELQIGGRRDAAAGSQAGARGTFTMAGSADVNLTGGFWVGSRGASGTATISGGTLDANIVRIGDNEGAVSAGTGALNISGGTITSRNEFQVGRHGGVGTVNQTGGTVNVNAGWFGIANDNAGSAGSSYSISAGNLNVNNAVDMEVGADTTGSLNISGTGAVTVDQLFAGHRVNGNGTVTQTGGSFIARGGDSRIGNAAGSTGKYDISGGTALFQGNFQIGASGNGTMNVSGGAVTANTWPVVGRFVGGVGNLNISSGTFTHSNATTRLIIGEEGTGTTTVSANGLLESAGGISMGHLATGNGTLQINGGTVQAPFIGKKAGAALINFNGGVVKATANTSEFLPNLDTNAVSLGTPMANTSVDVQAGGARIDTNGFNVTTAVALDGVGGLTKLGAGRLTLSGATTYSGDSTVDAGTLQIDGSVAGSVVTNTGAVLSGIGTVNSNVSVVGGTLSVGQNGGADAGTMNVVGTVTLNSASTVVLTINDDAPGGFDVINNTGSFSAGGAMLTGTFSDTTFSAALDAASLLTATRYKFVNGPVDMTTFGNATPLSAADLATLGLASGDEVTISGQRFLLEKGSWALVPIPEPGISALLALTGLGLLRRRRA